MTVRFDDAARTVALSARDLAEDGGSTGHLVKGTPGLAVVRSRAARAEAGRQAHLDWQLARATDSATFRAELTVKRTVAVGAWTAMVWGRIDGVDTEGDRTVVEEVKSTPLDARRLYATRPSDWPGWLAQLEIYLWMLAEPGSGRPDPVGRLVLVSLADGSRHVLGVALDAARVGARVHERLARLVDDRERRNAWMADRRARTVPLPHAGWRPGQREIAEAVEWGLEAGHPVLIEAPTGLGKTDAAMVGALKRALAADKQVFWATARTTQQPGVLRALDRLRGAGLGLRAVQLAAREKACLNRVVDCRPDACRFADGYFDRLAAAGLVPALAARDAAIGVDTLRRLGTDHVLCPFELGLDLLDHVDVAIGDYNYVLEPSVRLPRFDDAPDGWIVVVDEVHQLVDRARDWLSPVVEAAVAREAIAQLWSSGAEFAPFVGLAERIERLVVETARAAAPHAVRDRATAALPEAEVHALAREVDQLGIDYALLRADRPAPGANDAWVALARAVLRLASGLDARDQRRADPNPPGFDADVDLDPDPHATVVRDGGAVGDTVSIAHTAVGDERIGLWCLDPSGYLRPRLAALGGFVGLSATLRPAAFHRDLLGLPADRTDVVSVPSPFPPERRKVIVAPRISTAYKDREQHAGPTAALLARCVAAVPGNTAIYFPSFAMLGDIVGRVPRDPAREWLVQQPGMDDALRAEALTRLGGGGPPKVLCAVLGGVFAEGIDLPPGSLRAVIVVGPALPPIGLERDLLRAYFDARFDGQGFAFASLVPGLTRVVQAAGRLIRRPDDHGVIVLVDRRFRWRDLAAMLPSDWAPAVSEDPAPDIRAFFEAFPALDG